MRAFLAGERFREAGPLCRLPNSGRFLAPTGSVRFPPNDRPGAGRIKGGKPLDRPNPAVPFVFVFIWYYWPVPPPVAALPQVTVPLSLSLSSVRASQGVAPGVAGNECCNSPRPSTYAHVHGFHVNRPHLPTQLRRRGE
ncbi:adhesin [Anopheles sinensis]|uniref:Adhesin n=1 Tax=Anopheles sinensis TaxID=74873 RepID=A0A084VIB5_ANOSI|nr:adhesin [Anopheles sinensis]